MSQMYQIQLSSSVTRRVDAADEITYPIELTEILPSDDMRELFRQALEKRGFENDGNSADGHRLMGRGPAGEELTVDLNEMKVTARLEKAADLSTEVSLNQWVDEEYLDDARAAATDTMAQKRRVAEAQLRKEADGIQKDLSKRLADSEDARQRQLHEALQEAYAEALKQKAGQLGDITEMTEGTTADGQYELVIRVSQ